MRSGGYVACTRFFRELSRVAGWNTRCFIRKSPGCRSFAFQASAPSPAEVKAATANPAPAEVKVKKRKNRLCSPDCPRTPGASRSSRSRCVGTVLSPVFEWRGLGKLRGSRKNCFPGTGKIARFCARKSHLDLDFPRFTFCRTAVCFEKRECLWARDCRRRWRVMHKL